MPLTIIGRYTGASRYPTPENAIEASGGSWIPAFAGMTFIFLS